MPLWNSGTTWSSGQFWGPASPPVPAPEHTHPKRTKMKRQPYYPRPQGEQAEWHTNFATKLPAYATLLGLSQTEVDIAKHCQYGGG
jgi:hypothetical protein